MAFGNGLCGRGDQDKGEREIRVIEAAGERRDGGYLDGQTSSRRTFG